MLGFLLARIRKLSSPLSPGGVIADHRDAVGADGIEHQALEREGFLVGRLRADHRADRARTEALFEVADLRRQRAAARRPTPRGIRRSRSCTSGAVSRVSFCSAGEMCRPSSHIQ